MTDPVSDGVDLARLGAWMERQGLPQGPITGTARLAGGTQNVILRFAKGDREFVLRRPPVNTRAESNETMRREARVLAALAGTDVPHPRLIAACPTEDVLGAAFYLMEPVNGFNAVSTPLPRPHADDPVIRRAMGFALVDGALALGRVDYRAVGLEGFGKPDNYLERQVSRWRAQLAGYAQYHGWPGSNGIGDVERVAAYLERHVPRDYQPGIIHGDYLLGNVMFRHDGPGLAAIIDWELATIGDPLLDLGWIVATWRGVPPVDLAVLEVDPWNGFPTADELIAHYAAGSERDLSAIDWYVVLACFKLAIILEGTFARACAGRDAPDMGTKLHDTASRLIRRALHRIG